MDPFLTILHPDHVAYLKRAPLNSLGYLFAQLDQLDSQKRDTCMGWAYHIIINPRRRRPMNKDEKMGDLYIDEVSYEAFKRKCDRIVSAGVLDHMLLAHLIISFTLHCMLGIADITAIDEKVEDMRDLREFMAAHAEEGIAGRKLTPDFFELYEEQIRGTPERIQRNYADYQYFCENVIHALLDEEFKPPSFDDLFEEED